MPELPEVEQTRRSLEPLIGRRVTSVALRRRDICDSFGASGGARKTSEDDLLEGGRVARLERRGKQLAIIAEDKRSLCVQLGMSGRLRLILPDGDAMLPTHTHALWTFDDGSKLLFIDPRRFGGLSTYPDFDALQNYRWNALGPDALFIRPPHLARACAGSRRAIKTLLLDQSALAGVGNIYADESLFRARIHPVVSARALDREQIVRLSGAIRNVLGRAVDAGGTTLRDYSDSAGRKGRAQLLHAVYGRAGMACPRCGTSLAHLRVSQRATVFCPRCQPIEAPARARR